MIAWNRKNSHHHRYNIDADWQWVSQNSCLCSIKCSCGRGARQIEYQWHHRCVKWTRGTQEISPAHRLFRLRTTGVCKVALSRQQAARTAHKRENIQLQRVDWTWRRTPRKFLKRFQNRPWQQSPYDGLIKVALKAKHQENQRIYQGEYFEPRIVYCRLNQSLWGPSSGYKER